MHLLIVMLFIKQKQNKIIKIHTMFTSYILKGNRKSTH